ncbi:hypothetical protein BH09MYX1_BH09MYX1_35190 [soil metagenome]
MRLGIVGISAGVMATPFAGGACSAPAESPDFGRCTDGDPAVERHGANCLCCHQGEFSVAGSTAPGVALVNVRDRSGHALTMPVNPYGNFLQHRVVEGPLEATITLADGSVRRMKGEAPHGSCNACHDVNGPSALGL